MVKHGSWLPCKYEVPVDLLTNQANQSSGQRKLCRAEIPKPSGSIRTHRESMQHLRYTHHTTQLQETH